ncbi:MAG: ATP-binding protein [Bacteroidota bacterium]
MSILLIVSMLLALLASARALDMQPRSKSNYFMAASLGILSLVAFTEYLILNTTPDQLPSVKRYSTWHSVLLITLTIAVSWIGYLSGPSKTKGRTLLAYKALIGGHTFGYAVLMFALLSGQLNGALDQYYENGLWHYASNFQHHWTPIFNAWLGISTLLLSLFFYTGYRVERIVQIRKWKFYLFLLLTIAPICILALFVLPLPTFQLNVYLTAPGITLSMILMLGIYTNFGIFHPTSITVMDMLLDSVESTIVVLDKQLRISFHNELFQSELDRHQVALHAFTNFAEVLVQLGLEEWATRALLIELKQVYAGESLDIELEFDCAGNKRYFSVTLTPISSKQGKLKGYVYVGKEISAFKEDEQKLIAFAKQLERSNQELEQFAHIASHDLKTPIRNINSFANLLNRYLKQFPNAELQELANQIIVNATFIYRLIQNILEYSKIGQSPVALEATAMKRVLEIVEYELMELVEEKNAIIKYKNLPVVHSSFPLMSVLMINLVENGIKFNDSVIPEVQIHAIENKGNWVVQVRDNGIGIAPEYQTSIFEMFNRLNGYADFKDTGVGLALCQKIIQLHKGELWLESTPEGGSSFYFTIPKHENDFVMPSKSSVPSKAIYARQAKEVS